jgi:hypothetical protein
LIILWDQILMVRNCNGVILPVSLLDTSVFDIYWYNWQHCWLRYARHQMKCSEDDFSNHEWSICCTSCMWRSGIPPTLARGSLLWCKLVLEPVWMDQILT